MQYNIGKNKTIYRILFFEGWTRLIGSIFYTADRCIQYGIPAAVIVFSAVMIDKIDENKLRNKFLEYLGTLSFSIYLTHAFFSMFFGLMIKNGHFKNISPDLLIISEAVETILITSISYKIVEEPLLKKLSNKKALLNRSN